MILIQLMISLVSFSYIPKPTTIFQRLAENGGSGIYTIEQEIVFSTQPEPIALKETWTIENDSKMKLEVTGLKELKNQVHLVYHYENGVRSVKNETGKIEQRNLDENFIEKYFHIRKAEHYASILTQMKVLPNNLIQRKPYRQGAEPEEINDPHIRLARIGGTISYALGLPEDAAINFFIEQDTFNLKKIRLKINSEIFSEQYSTYSRGLNFPKLRIIKWTSSPSISEPSSISTVHQAAIHTLKVLGRGEKASSSLIEVSKPIPSELGANKNLIEEFYSRFR